MTVGNLFTDWLKMIPITNRRHGPVKPVWLISRLVTAWCLAELTFDPLGEIL